MLKHTTKARSSSDNLYFPSRCALTLKDDIVVYPLDVTMSFTHNNLVCDHKGI